MAVTNTDPVIKLLGYQRKLVLDESRFICAKMARGTRKSWTGTLKVVRKIMHKEAAGGRNRLDSAFDQGPQCRARFLEVVAGHSRETVRPRVLQQRTARECQVGLAGGAKIRPSVANQKNTIAALVLEGRSPAFAHST